MAGQYRFKDSNGNIVAQISASADGTISFSGSQMNFAQANTIDLGTVQLAGTASNALLLNGYNAQSFGLTSSLHPFTASIAGTNTFTSSALVRLNALETTSASVNTTDTTQNTRLTNLENKTGSLATTGSNTFIGTQVITGSLYVTTNLIVQGSSSIQNITGSSVNIGTNTVVLNTANPAVRYAGISVIDSGSTGLTGSILWDSTNNNWLYQNPSGSSYTSAKFISGPQSSTLGAETGLTTGYIPRAVGDDHIGDSVMFQSGSRLGLGTTTPNAMIHTTGSIWITDNPGTNALIFGSNAQGTAKYSYITSTTEGAQKVGLAIYTTSDAGTSNQERVRITDSGYVGIGTTSPSLKLDVRGGVSIGGTTDGIRLGYTGDNSSYDNIGITYTGYNAGSPEVVFTPRTTPGSGALTTYFRFKNSNGASSTNNYASVSIDGYLGVGTTTLAAPLTVYGDIYAGYGGPASNRGLYVGNSGYQASFLYNNSTGNLEISPRSGYSTIFTSGAVTINGILTSSVNNNIFGTASSSGRAIRIQAGSANQAIQFLNSSGGDGTLYAEGTSTAMHYRFDTYSTSNALFVANGGNIGIGTNNPGQKIEVVSGHIKITTSGYGLILPGAIHTSAQINFYNANSAYELMKFPLANQTITLYGAADKLYYYSDKSGIGNFFTLNSDGNVGIGNTTPTERLYVSGNIYSTDTVYGRNIQPTAWATITAGTPSGAGIPTGYSRVYVSSPCDGTWRTILTNVNDTKMHFWASIGDAASKDTSQWYLMTTSPAYGVSGMGNINYQDNGWNTGAHNFRIIDGGSGTHHLQISCTSYYSSSNTATGNIYFLRME